MKNTKEKGCPVERKQPKKKFTKYILSPLNENVKAEWPLSNKEN